MLKLCYVRFTNFTQFSLNYFLRTNYVCKDGWMDSVRRENIFFYLGRYMEARYRHKLVELGSNILLIINFNLFLIASSVVFRLTHTCSFARHILTLLLWHEPEALWGHLDQQ